MLNFGKQTYQTIEYEGPKPSPWIEDEESIAALAHHPGFTALMRKLAVQRAALDTLLRRTKHKDMRAVDNLQNGIAWTEWLSNEVNKLVYKKAQVQPVVAREDERAEFEKIHALIESV